MNTTSVMPATSDLSISSPWKTIMKGLFQYKLYHIFFWFLYHYLWAIINVRDPWEVTRYVFTTPSVKFGFYVIVQAAGVYFNLYFLIPRYLEKNRFWVYVFSLTITILCTAGLIVPGYYLGAFFSDTTVQALYGTANFSHLFLTFTFPSTMGSMTLAMSIKLTKNWMQAKRRERLLEKEKLETELKFLRSQFNPHFLFNTINSIFVLINKDPRMASDSLAKFSGLLRYQLYECNEHYIPVVQELSYLDNFIELEKLRHVNIETKLTIEEPSASDLAIAPFILMPFIENAFKHVSQGKERSNWINMDLRFEQNEMFFFISNSIGYFNNLSQNVISHKGIGLKNVQRRLALLYPNMHDLKFTQDGDQFQVMLWLKLSAIKMDVPVSPV